MDELIRTKMHEALDVEQPDGALRSRILSSLPADDRLDRARKGGVIPIGRRTELAAAIAAVVLAAIVVGSFTYIRAVSRAHTVTPPITSASPSAPFPGPSPTLTQPLNVGASTPVILFTDGGNASQIDGVTWDGQRAGKITAIPDPAQSVCQTTGNTQVCSPPPVGGGAPPLSSAESSNPDGALFVAFPYFYDRSGRVVATLNGGPYADPGVGEYFVGTWADDELHYCQVVPLFGGTSAVTGTLQLTTPGGSVRDVAHLGQQAPAVNTLTVTTCSVLADRAVVIQADPNSGPNGNPPLHYWVVQLSSGHVLWTHDLTGKGITNVVASRDGRYVAETESNGTTTIYGPNGSQVGHANGSVEAFSWDGSLAVAVAKGGQATVIRWSDGTVIWTVPPGEGLSGFQPEPGGTSFAITTVNSLLYVVSSDGRVLGQREVPGGLLGCLPKACASTPASDVMQVLPLVMDGSVGWAAGPQRTTDGGLHWQDVSPPTPANRTKGGFTDYFLDASHAWVTVATGAVALQNATSLVVFATADGGQTWSQGSVPISGVVSETARLDFIDAQHGWVVIDSGPNALDKTNTSITTQPVSRAIYATTDGGRTWSQLASAQEGDGSTLGTLALGCSMSGLTFVSLDHGWLTWDCNSGIGSVPPTSQHASSMVAETQDGGHSWQPVELPSFPSTNDYICTANPPVFTQSQGILPVFCGGIGRQGFSAVYATSDAGRSWSFRKIPFFTGQLEFTDANTGWTFGATGASLYRTTNGGISWSVVKRFTSEQNSRGLSFVDSKTGFALTSRYAPDGNSGFSTMWKTTDGGQTWSVMSSIPTGPRCC